MPSVTQKDRLVGAMIEGMEDEDIVDNWIVAVTSFHPLEHPNAYLSTPLPFAPPLFPDTLPAQLPAPSRSSQLSPQTLAPADSCNSENSSPRHVTGPDVTSGPRGDSALTLTDASPPHSHLTPLFAMRFDLNFGVWFYPFVPLFPDPPF